jgi:hypothetical protein
MNLEIERYCEFSKPQAFIGLHKVHAKSPKEDLINNASVAKEEKTKNAFFPLRANEMMTKLS